jgi:exodeoxyribonuclease VII large subunit
MNPGEILSISELNQTARILLEEGLGAVWVQGEISNFSVPASGHWYFSLKDAGAQVRCAMFAGRNRQVNFEPRHGMQVMAYAQVSLYENRGDFQLIVEKLEPIGDGALQFELERLMRKLAAEGLFDTAHKKPLPSHPQTIGIITSSTGAALRDILHVLKRRAPNISVIIYPTVVQGMQAAPQIVDAIQTANHRNECDVLLIARGGGSLEDLWPFNEEIVARAIFHSKIPIISGVGHEVDFTICDSVADVRAPTPSAAAELVSPNRLNLVQDLQKYEQWLTQSMQQKLNLFAHQLNALQRQLKHPKEYWQQISQFLDFQEARLNQLMQSSLERKRQQFELVTQALNNLNPLAVLNRGYAVALDEEQKVLSSVKQFTPGKGFHLKLKDGVVAAITKKP